MCDYDFPLQEAVSISISSVLLLVALAELVFSILSAVYCCLIMADKQSSSNPLVRSYLCLFPPRLVY